MNKNITKILLGLFTSLMLAAQAQALTCQDAIGTWQGILDNNRGNIVIDITNAGTFYYALFYDHGSNRNYWLFQGGCYASSEGSLIRMEFSSDYYTNFEGTKPIHYYSAHISGVMDKKNQLNIQYKNNFTNQVRSGVFAKD